MGPNIVLDLLRKWAPVRKLDLKVLTLKTLMLILLATGTRLDTISKITLDKVERKANSFVIDTALINKQSRQGYKDPVLVLKSYPPDRRLCVFLYLTKYLARTATVKSPERTLFVTYQKPMHSASKDTLSRWTKLVMKQAGIDTKVFSSHSVRGATTSAATQGGANLDEVLMTAGWSNNSTFAKFYKRPLLDREKLSMQEAVLARAKH